MPFPYRKIIGAAAMGAILSLSGVASAAGFGYVPTSIPVPPGTPGGFNRIVTVQTVVPTSNHFVTVAARVAGSPVRVVVPPHAFSGRVQIVVTQPDLAVVTDGVQHLHFRGWRAIAGVGVSVVTPTGHLDLKKFLKPITVIILNRRIRPDDRMVEWNAHGRFFPLPRWTTKYGVARRMFEVDPGFAVLMPPPALHHVTHHKSHR
ncbi:MAG: hypothetical protein OWU84_04350 [Firmicutes bacterium]|nr:hypothetical protein [Bacillota bacterium]